MNFPDRIFAIGGAGKAIAFTLLEQDWVLESIIEPTLSTPQTVTVTIIDSADGPEHDQDLERVRDARRRVQKFKDEARESGEGRPGDIEIDYKLLTGNVQLNSQIDLIGDQATERITAGNGMDEEDWWLDGSHIKENLDFATGVVRRRALGKAVYYKAYAEDSSLSSVVDLPQRGRVAVLVGLGGGTGSGVFLDLARQIQERQRTAEITLFGVLPNDSEGPKESANAYAALSELEALNVQGDPIFKDRVLLPIAPTGFDGKLGDRARVDEVLQEFDEAIVYLLAGYYNQEGTEDPFADSPAYAPFIIGVPQVLRYNVEAIEDARQSLSTILELKREALNAEERIYEELDRFVTREYGPESPTGSLSEVDRVDLEGRIESIEELLNFELFEELDYETLDLFGDMLEQAESEGEDIKDQIEILTGNLRTVDVTRSAEFKDDIDRNLSEIIEQDLRLISKRLEMLLLRHEIEESDIRDAVENVLSAGDTTVSGLLVQTLEATKENLEQRASNLKAEIEETNQEIESIREQNSDEINRRFDRWENEVEDAFSQLEATDGDAIERQVDSLMNELQTFAGELSSAQTQDEVDQVSDAEISRQLNQLEDEFQAVGANFSEFKSSIQQSVDALRKARQSIITINKDKSAFESLAPWETSTEQERDDANRDYRIQRTKMDDEGVFRVGADTQVFQPEVTLSGDQLVDAYRGRRSELERLVIRALEEDIEDVSDGIRRDIENALEGRVDRSAVESRVNEAFREAVGDTDEIERRKHELEAELEQVQADLSRYDAALDLFETASPQSDTYENKTREFQEKLDEEVEAQSNTVVARNTDYNFIKEVQPVDVFKTTQGRDINKAGLLQNDVEAERVVDNIQELAENARKRRYTDLNKRKINVTGRRYEDMTVNVGFISRAVDQLSNEATDLQPTFSESFDVNTAGRQDSDYVSWKHDSGGPWDIGVSVFIDGVFLDNIESVVAPGGYKDSYEDRAGRMESGALIHHVLGLDEGHFVRRNQLLNMEDPEDVEFYLQDEVDVMNQLDDDLIGRIPTNDEQPSGGTSDD